MTARISDEAAACIDFPYSERYLPTGMSGHPLWRMTGSPARQEAIMIPDPKGPAALQLPGQDHVVPDVSERELPLPDVPLIVEDLLNKAKEFANSGAPTEAIEEILDHVATLKEGRD